MSIFDKGSRLTNKERLQIDLVGVHRTMIKEDEIKRRENRIKIIMLEKSGWFVKWREFCINHRSKPMEIACE